jgi:signal transduction histidine kinase
MLLGTRHSRTDDLARQPSILAARVGDVEFAALVSQVAHELRSPLTSIKGFSATLVKSWDRFSDDERRRFVETISADAERMNRIVFEVLEAARVESGRLRLELRETALKPLVTRAVERLSQLPGAERVTTEVDEALSANVDAARLENVMATLIENAIKFSDEGFIEVEASPRERAVELRVRDRGVGIDEDRIRELFDRPSRQVEYAAPSGSGLGLYLAKRLVEAQGGSIGVESASGAGSTFTVLVPRAGRDE